MIPVEKRWYWVVGTVLACVGVLAARVVTPRIAPDAQGYVRSFGVMVALAGLLIIMLGTRRKG